MSSSQQIRVGIVGAGYVSPYHLRALQTLAHVSIVGIADRSVERARQLAEQFGISGVFGSLGEMARVKPDVIHVLTPPSSHCQITLEALGMGCDVFVEKPMAPTRHECDQMIAAAQRAGRVLSVNHSAKADPVVVHGLQLVTTGVLGDVIAVDFCRSSDYPLYSGGPMPAQFRLGGYPFEDIGIHGLYLLESFLGTIRNVDVRYRTTGRQPNVYFDEWRATVDCDKGVGQMFLSWATRPLRNELTVHGTKGYLHIDCFLQTCTVHSSLPGPKPITASIDAAMTALGTLYKVPRNMVRFATGKLRPSPGIHAGVLQFHDALRRGVAPPVSMDEGRRMVGWVEDACLSADTDKDAALRVHERVPPARILVTGATGFLGRALLDRLCAGAESVRVLARRPAPHVESLPGVHVVCGDLGDPDVVDRAIAGVELVYHVGATMRGRGWPDFEAGTVQATANVVHSCLRHHVGRLVYVSSMTVLDYATHQPGAVVREDTPLEPFPEQRGAYTQAKLRAENIVLEAVRTQGLPAVVIRPGQIFGPGAESIPPYGTIALAGQWMVIGSGTLRCPLVFIEDVVDGLLAAAKRTDVCGSIFHLVDPTAITQNEYIAACQTAMQNLPRVVHAPRWLLYAAGAALEVLGRLLKRGVPLSRYRVASIKELRFDCSSAEEKLEWIPAVGARKGLSLMSCESHAAGQPKFARTRTAAKVS
jgi:predicted dehydrogenase/nucleoside-diphosphate-sugar epimerase